jgi:hypothetical protein
MALTNINDNFQLDAPKHLDNRTGNYASVAEANASIPEQFRIQGLEVVVITAGEAVKYYYRDGVADGDLVIMPTGGGGGSTPTLAEVLDEGNTADEDIVLLNDSKLQLGSGGQVLLDNGSRLKEGTIDQGLGGSKGISQICAVGYEKKWEAGREYIMNDGGTTIREARYNFAQAPSINDDITTGFIVGSRWVLDNGTLYICTDNTDGAAVWELQAGAGDMFKSVYDTDNDGIVDKAERIEIIVRNSTGSTLSKGKVVYISGATGNRPNAILAAANTKVAAINSIGIVTADIPNNSDGFVAVNGTLHNLNLSSFSAGDLLWLSTTAGNYVANTPPAEPNYSVFIGYVARAHPTDGRLVIKIQNGYELKELHGVEITSPATNDFLYYGSDGLWKNKQLSKSDVGLSNVPNTDATNPANITQTASYRFVTDTEKSTWNGKQDNITSVVATAGSVSITITATGAANLQTLTGHSFTINEALMPVGATITINGLCERIATGTGIGGISYDINGVKRYYTSPSGHQYQYQITIYRESSTSIRMMGGSVSVIPQGAFGSANIATTTAAVTAGGNIVFQLFGFGSVVSDQIAYRFFKAVLTR